MNRAMVHAPIYRRHAKCEESYLSSASPRMMWLFVEISKVNFHYERIHFAMVRNGQIDKSNQRESVAFEYWNGSSKTICDFSLDKNAIVWYASQHVCLHESTTRISIDDIFRRNKAHNVNGQWQS